MNPRAQALVLTTLVLCAAGALPTQVNADLLISNNGSFVGPDTGTAIVRLDEQTGASSGQFNSGDAGAYSGLTGMARNPADGNLYVSSSGTGDIVEYNGATGAFIKVFASGLAGPAGLAFGPDGNLYIANRAGTNIERINGQTGADMGAFTNDSNLTAPTVLAFGPDHNLYVGSLGNDITSVMRYDGTTGQSMGVFATTTDGSLLGTGGLLFAPDGSLFVSSILGNVILKYGPSGGDSPAVFATLPHPGQPLDFNPGPLLFDRDGNLLVAPLNSFVYPQILRFDSSTGTALTPISTGTSVTIPGAMLLFTPGDINGDNKVTGADYTIWADNFNKFSGGGATVAQGDLNGDGKVTGADYTIWADHFSPVVAVSSFAIPEPATWLISLVGLGGLILLAPALNPRRRRPVYCRATARKRP